MNELNTLPAVVLVTHGCILAGALALPFGIAVGVTPIAALIALIMLLAMMIYIGFNVFSARGGDAVLIRELHKRLQKMLINWGCLKVKTKKVAAAMVDIADDTTAGSQCGDDDDVTKSS